LSNYVLALKQNQGTLYEDVVELFDDLEVCPDAYAFDTATTVDEGHGRVDVRHSWLVTDPQLLALFRSTDRWPGLQSIVKVQAERYLPSGEAKVKVRYFISSLNTTAQIMLATIRTHWHIENRLHWVVDVAFREDDSRLRKDHGAHNFAILRRIAHNLLKQESSRSDSIKSKRARAGWDNHYLLKVLASLFH
jgi:predicted transposase YbfD/YdcC